MAKRIWYYHNKEFFMENKSLRDITHVVDILGRLLPYPDSDIIRQYKIINSKIIEILEVLYG